MRLIDAVALAASCLLLLKLAAFVTDVPAKPSVRLPDFVRDRQGGHWVRAALPDDDWVGLAQGQVEGQGGGRPPEMKPAEPQAQVPAAEPASLSERAILDKLGTRRESLKQRTNQLQLREQMLDTGEKSSR